MRLALALTALALCACVPTEQQVQRDAAMCAGYGFTPGTDGMAACMMQQDQTRKAAASESLRRLGENMQRNADRYRQPVNCTTRPFGYQQVQTTCY